MDSFGLHVVGRADQRVSHGGLWAEEPAQPEVPDLDNTLSGDEDIGGLDVWKFIFILQYCPQIAFQKLCLANRC